MVDCAFRKRIYDVTKKIKILERIGPRVHVTSWRNHGEGLT
jgi:hypothetical protein